VPVLSQLFRRLFLEKLVAAHQAGQLQFFNRHAGLVHSQKFAAFLAPVRNQKWVVYCKRPFAGPKDVLRYLARYTHRVAISNRRLIACNDKGVTFKWKDYRRQGHERYQVMTLATGEFIRRFLIHVLPAGFHRIRYYGLLASGKRVDNIARARELLMPPIIPVEAIKAISADAAEPQTTNLCPCCGGRMVILERFECGATPHYRASPPTAAIRVDTS
jgi:Putative transposase